MGMAYIRQNFVKSGNFVGHLSRVNTLRSGDYFLASQNRVHISYGKIGSIHEFFVVVDLEPSLYVFCWLILEVLAQWQIWELFALDYWSIIVARFLTENRPVGRLGAEPSEEFLGRPGVELSRREAHYV